MWHHTKSFTSSWCRISSALTLWSMVANLKNVKDLLIFNIETCLCWSLQIFIVSLALEHNLFSMFFGVSQATTCSNELFNELCTDYITEVINFTIMIKWSFWLWSTISFALFLIKICPVALSIIKYCRSWTDLEPVVDLELVWSSRLYSTRLLFPSSLSLAWIFQLNGAIYSFIHICSSVRCLLLLFIIPMVIKMLTIFR